MALTQDLKILLSCYVFYIFLNGILFLVLHATNAIISFIFLPLIMFFAIKGAAIPKPSNADVKAILGIDVWQQFKDSMCDKSEVESDGLIFRTIAHRGAGLDAPENSFSGLKSCHSKGCNFVEIDLSLTKDNIPVVFHDVTLNRMVGVPGKVYELLWDELKDYNLVFQPNSKEKEAFHSEKIPLFNEFIDMCVKLDIRVFIDIKDKREEVVKIILDTYKRHPTLYSTSFISSFNPYILYKIRKCDPKIACSMAWRPDYFSRAAYDPVCTAPKRYSSLLKHAGAVILDSVSTWLTLNFVYYLLGLSVILIHKDAVSIESIAKWHRRNVRVIAWTVNSKIEKDFFANVLNIPYMTDSLEYNHINREQERDSILLEREKQRDSISLDV